MTDWDWDDRDGADYCDDCGLDVNDCRCDCCPDCGIELDQADYCSYCGWSDEELIGESMR